MSTVKKTDPLSTGIPVEQTQAILAMLFSDRMRDSPLNYVMWAFPWGVKGTRLEKYSRPAQWQIDELANIGEHIRQNKNKIARGETPTVYRSAVASGRGIGKSALVAWLTLWMLSCHPGSSTQLSANTEDQLTTKTFAEIGKWLTLAINSHFFDSTTRKITPASWYCDALKRQLKIDDTYYYANGVLWDEDNPASFAGVHSDVGVLLIFDEASGIPAPIWKESEGFFTERTPYRFWLAFSNPRRNSGAFYDCFFEHQAFWKTRHINALDIETQYSDRQVYEQIIAQYGGDSDEAKIHVYGLFPDQSDRQFIPRGLVTEARHRTVDRREIDEPLLMGVDPARYGRDATVIRFRSGRDAKSIPPIELRKKDSMFIANLVAELIEERDVDAVFIDGQGNGGGVVDRLKEMGYGKKIFDVTFGSKANNEIYFDHRVELWARLRDWLVNGSIDSTPKLLTDLNAPEWKAFGPQEKIKLESKEDMEKRGIKSTDHADALALTFHCQIARKHLGDPRRMPGRRKGTRIAAGVDYKIFGAT